MEMMLNHNFIQSFLYQVKNMHANKFVVADEALRACKNEGREEIV